MELGMALLGRCDTLTLSRLLAVRSFMGGILNNMASDPPGVTLKLLQLLATRCLGAESGEGDAHAPPVPTALRVEVFADSALQQLAQVVLHLEDLDSAAGDSILAEQGMISSGAQISPLTLSTHPMIPRFIGSFGSRGDVVFPVDRS